MGPPSKLSCGDAGNILDTLDRASLDELLAIDGFEWFCT